MISSQKLKEKYFKQDEHPYRIFENQIHKCLAENNTLLDAGCGYTANVLRKYKDIAGHMIGIDLVDFDEGSAIEGMDLYTSDLENIPVESNSVDLIISRSVFEHLEHPEPVYNEFSRVLKKGGRMIILTPNLGDYSAWVSMAMPNRWHPWIVSKTEGRDERDTFPAFYRTNTKRKVKHLATQTGFEIIDFQYLGQYPCYFMFNPYLFFIATGYEKLISRYDALKYLRGWILFTLQKR